MAEKNRREKSRRAGGMVGRWTWEQVARLAGGHGCIRAGGQERGG